MTWLDVIQDAFTEVQVRPPDQQLQPSLGDWGLRKLNRLLDNWKSRRLYAFSISRLELSITTAKADGYTIGQSGSADFTQDRPIKIERANWVLPGGSPAVRLPLDIITFEWQAAYALPGLQSGIPSSLYYNPTYPDGTLILYPVPDATGILELYVWEQLGEVALASATDDIEVPPGYRDAIIWNLAESFLASYPNAKSTPMIQMQARKSRSEIQSLNSKLPRIETRDTGAPSGNGRGIRPSFSWRTGLGA